MAQATLTKYTFDNTIGDVLPTITPDTVEITYTDTVNGSVTTREVFIDDSNSITQIKFDINPDALLTCNYLRINNEITNLGSLFYGCHNLTFVDTSNWNTENVVDMHDMFNGCSSLVELDLSSFYSNNVTNFSGMFQECTNLVTLDISNFHFGGVNQNPGQYMFYKDTNLKHIGMIYCRASSFNSLQKSFNNLVATPVNVYYHDASLSDLTPHANVTYVYYDKSTVTLPYELNKLPNGVADYIDVVNGVYVQRVGKFIANGTESWGIGTFANASINDQCTIFTHNIKDKKDNYNYNNSKLCDKWTLSNSDVITIANVEGIPTGGNADSFFINVSNSKATTVEQWKAYLQSNPFTYMYELATPIYTPLTDEEKALLPLSAYSNGYVQLSSDELRPSKFEFRTKSNNRLQLDMLETGYYYLDAPTGNVKLGNVDVNVTEMPCLIKVDNASNNRLVVNAADFFCKDILLNYEEGFLNIGNGTVSADLNDGRWASDFVEIPYYDKAIYIMNDTKLVDVCYYDENKNFITGVAVGNVNLCRELYLTGNTTVKYMRFSGGNSERVLSLRSHVITLSKLPSHRIPTTFTQGMESSIDFGYWQGSKEARATTFRTTYATGNWDIVDAANINNGTGIVLNRVVLDGKIIEDELDISTGKYIKRIEKVIINGSENWTQNTGGTVFVNANSYFTLLSKRSSGYDCYSDKLKFRAYWSADEPRVWIDGKKRLVVHLPFVVSYNETVLKQYLSENPITVYYELETPEISYLELPTNAPKTVADKTALQSLTSNGNLFAQVKPSPLSYPTTLSPNTQYTVFHNRKNYNDSVKTPMINLGGTEVSATGSRTVVTTPSTLAHNELQFIGAENTVEQVMVLHGDWTKEGKTVDYFEGLQSSIIGDKTLENLVDEPVEIWSIKVTSNGAVDYVSMDDIIAEAYGNRAKLPEVQVGTNVRTYGMTLNNIIADSSIWTGAKSTFTYDGYTITVTGSGASDTIWTNIEIRLKEVKSNTNYFVKWDSITGEINNGFVRVYDSATNASLENTLGLPAAVGQDYTAGNYLVFNSSSYELNNIRIRFHLNGSDTQTNTIHSLIIKGLIICEYQQGMENWDIPFFEGMKSVENPKLVTIGKNLIDDTVLRKVNLGTQHYTQMTPIHLIEGDVHVDLLLDNDIKPSSRWFTTRLYDKPGNLLMVCNPNTTTTITKEIAQQTAYMDVFTNLEHDYGNVYVKQLCVTQNTSDYTYEPYKENVLSTPQGTVLRSVGSYKDTMGWNDGIIRRNCVEFTISGEEGYSIHNIVENTNTISCGISWETLGLENKIPTNDNVNMPICDKLPTIAGSGDTPHIRQDGNQPYSRTLMFWLDKTKFSTYTSQGINDYIKSIGGLTIVAPLADTGYEDVEIIGGGNWNKAVLDGSEGWTLWTDWHGASDLFGAFLDNYVDYDLSDGNDVRFFTNDIEVVGSVSTTNTNNICMDREALVLRQRGDGLNRIYFTVSKTKATNITELKQYLANHSITGYYRMSDNSIDVNINTDPLVFNHGTLYTTTDTHPSTFLDFSLKTTNRYTVKGFDKLKYTVLTEQPFYFNGVDYPTSSTGMTIIDVTGIADSSVYSDDTMITVVQDDGNYYADGVLTQFKGEKTFVKEFIRTSNDTYNTGMTLLEPLELNSMSRVGVYDYYNPITGEVIKNTGKITITGNEYYWDGYINYITDTSHASYSPFVCLAQIPALPYNRSTSTQSTVNNLGSDNVNMLWSKECNEIVIGVNATNLVVIRVPLDKMEENSHKGLQKFVQENPITLVYQLETPQIIQATPTSTYISTRPENGNIVAQDTQIQAEYLNYDNEQSIISPRMLSDGDEIRWELGSQCYVYENDNEYIPLTEHNELFGANLQAQEYTQYAESVDGADIEVGVALKEKAVYEQTYVKYEDKVVYPETMENIDETNGVEVDYICGATWQNPNDLSDIRHLGELREDGQYDVTIRRSGDDEIRLLEGTTHIGLDYDVLPPSEFELTFFNNGGVEVGKYGDTTHVLEDCVQDSKLASGTIYGQTLNNLYMANINTGENGITKFENGIITIGDSSTTRAMGYGGKAGFKTNTTYTVITNVIKNTKSNFTLINSYDANGGDIAKTRVVLTANQVGLVKQTFTTRDDFTIYNRVGFESGIVGEIQFTYPIILEGDWTNNEFIGDILYFKGMGSTVVNGFSSCGKNLVEYTNNVKNVTPATDVTLNYKDNGFEFTTTETQWRNAWYDLQLNPNTTYTISYNSNVMDCFIFKSKVSTYVNSECIASKALKNKNDALQNLNLSFTSPSDGFVRIRLTNSNLSGYHVVKNLQVEQGSVATEFEPYKPTNYTLPTPITLRKVGDVCDTFDVTTGKLTQRIGEVVLDGSETWEYNVDWSMGDYYACYTRNVENKKSGVYNLKSPNYQTERDITNRVAMSEFVCGESSNNVIYIVVAKSKLTPDENNNYKKSYLEYLNNNPVTVQYELATESAKTINLIPSTTQTMLEPTFILPQPLRSVPNGICDRLYWDENKGHYCIEKRVISYLFDENYTYSRYRDFTNVVVTHTHTSQSFNKATNSFTSDILSNTLLACDNHLIDSIGFNHNGEKYIYFRLPKSDGVEYTVESITEWFKKNPTTVYYSAPTPEIIDLPHLDKKVELPTQPNIYPIGYKVIHEKANPELGLTIPYKVLNMPTQPTNLNFVMDIADYVLTWDDVKEARQYNIILNDEVIATVKEPQFNTGEEMYGYILVEANNEIGDNLSEELYIKTVPNAPAQLTVAHNPQTDYYDFEISFIDTSDIADYYTVMYKVDGGEWVINTIQNSELTTGEKHLWSFSVYEIKESIEVWATATNDVGTNDILPTAIYYMSPTPQWTYRINSKDVFLRWLDESPYDTKYKLRYSYKSNGQYQYAYFEGDAAEIGKLYEAVLPLAEDDEVTLALCIVSEKENLYCKPVKASKPLDPNIVPPMNFNYHWLARGLIEFYWQDQYDVDVEYEYILESMKANETLWTQVNKIIPSEDVEGTGTIYRVEYQLEDLEQIRMKVRMKWAMNETEWTETLTTVFIPVEGNPPTYIRRTQTAEGLLIEWEAQAYIDSYHIYVIDNETGEELQHLETQDNSILVDLDYSNSIEIAIYEISRFSGGIESDPTDPMVFTPTMFATDIDQRIYQPCAEKYPIEVSTVQKGNKQAYVIHDVSYTPNVETEHEIGVSIATPFTISYHPMMVDVHQAGSRSEATINAHIKTLNTRNEDLIRVMTFERITDVYDMDFRVYTPSVASYPINLEVSKVRIVCLGDSLTSGHPFYWAETGTGDITASYPYQLSRRLKNQYEVINSGYGSDTTDRCLARFDKDVLRYQPQYCIFQCGTNDLYWAMAESLNDQAALDMKMAVVRDNTMEVAKRCWDAGIIPIIGTLIPRTGATGIYKTALFEHNEWIISWCNEQAAAGMEIFYVDFFNAGKDVVPPTPLEDPNNPGAMNPIYDGDNVYDEWGNLEKQGRGIHLNPEGYAIMASAVPTTIFQTYDTGLKMYQDAQCTVEDPYDDSDAVNPFYTLAIDNVRRNKTKTVVRYVKNIGRTQVLFAMYTTDPYNCTIEFIGTDGSTGQFANGLLAPNMIARVVMNIDVGNESSTASFNMHLASREYSQS